LTVLTTQQFKFYLDEILLRTQVTFGNSWKCPAHDARGQLSKVYQHTIHKCILSSRYYSIFAFAVTW